MHHLNFKKSMPHWNLFKNSDEKPLINFMWPNSILIWTMAKYVK